MIPSYFLFPARSNTHQILLGKRSHSPVIVVFCASFELPCRPRHVRWSVSPLEYLICPKQNASCVPLFQYTALWFSDLLVLPDFQDFY